MLESVYTLTTCQRLDPLGFLRIEFRPSHHAFDLHEAKLNVKAARILTKGKNIPVLVDLRKGFHAPSPEARQYIARDHPYTRNRLAEAFLLESLGTYLLINFYIRFNKPPNPARVFKDEDAAIGWLKTFL